MWLLYFLILLWFLFILTLSLNTFLLGFWNPLVPFGKICTWKISHTFRPFSEQLFTILFPMMLSGACAAGERLLLRSICCCDVSRWHRRLHLSWERASLRWLDLRDSEQTHWAILPSTALMLPISQEDRPIHLYARCKLAQTLYVCFMYTQGHLAEKA